MLVTAQNNKRCTDTCTEIKKQYIQSVNFNAYVLPSIIIIIIIIIIMSVFTARSNKTQFFMQQHSVS